MNARQYVLHTTGRTVLSAMQTITAKRPDPVLLAVQTALDNVLSDIDTDAASQADPITGKTASRNQVFAVAAQTTRIIARLTLGYALEHGLSDLAAHVDVPANGLARGRLTQRVLLMQQVHNAAADMIVALAAANVTPEMLADQQAKIDAAKEVITLPRSTIAARRVATERVERGFRRLQRLFRYQLDPQFDRLKKTDPESYALYRAARLVIDRSGSRRATVMDGAGGATAPAAPAVPEAHPVAA